MSVLVLLGTRPEAIKLAPVVRALRTAEVPVRVVLTGQHRELVRDLLATLDLAPDADLDVMQSQQSLNGLAAALFAAIGDELSRSRPSALVVQGDTTSAMVGALAAFHEKVPVAHVEAGLRSGRIDDPFPEELNRQVVSRAARWHFAPTARSGANLVAEGAAPSDVVVTGNTVIDSLLWVRSRGLGSSAFTGEGRSILITLHRRENHGDTMRGTCRAIAELVRDLGLEAVLPVHPNPAVSSVVNEELGGIVRLVPPMDYVDFTATLAEATLVLTDSGGVQEEAPSLGVPVLVLRDTTERPEAVEAGCARLIGTDPERLIAEATVLLTSAEAHAAMAQVANPYGDGQAGPRIAGRLKADLGS